MSRVLILSDGRAGHLNQSLAFAKIMALPYDIVSVRFKCKCCKPLTYLFDKIGLYTDKLFDANIDRSYTMVVGAGSGTAYATKVLAKKMAAKSVAMMLPRAYRYDLDIIFAQSHDHPPKQKNIIEIPANFAYVEPRGIYQPKKKCLGIVIGGDNSIFTLSEKSLKAQLDSIVHHYKGYEIAVTTSPRTSKTIENLLASYDFDYEILFSKDPVNPIPDFLDFCETVCVTGDSTSMISEAISFGNANVIVLPLESRKNKKDNKFSRFIETLEKGGYLHIFNGAVKNKNKKIEFKTYLKEMNV